MTSSKKPAPDGEPRRRGRPTQHLAMTPQQAGDALDRMLGKKSAPVVEPEGERALIEPRKRPKKK